MDLFNNNQKPFMSADELIEKLAKKGVTFELTTTDEAKRYLKKNNNYYKLTSYRKNFEKDSEGKYLGLEFAYLKDLAIIDMLFRYQVIKMALDIEHFEKVRLLTFLKSKGDDGYMAVDSYKESLRTSGEYKLMPLLENLETEINNNKTSVYCRDMLNHISPRQKMPVWVFTEVITFGTFRNFFQFCATSYKEDGLIDEAYRLKMVKSLRNAAGHSNCVFNDLTLMQPNSKIDVNKAVLNKLATTNILSVEDGANGRLEPSEIQNDRIKEIITLFFVHSRILPSLDMREHYKIELADFVLRMNRHLDDYYKDNMPITNAFTIIQKIVETWY